MSYCKNCGAYIPVSYDNCPACGKKTSEAEAAAAAAQAAEEAQATEQKKREYREHKESGEYHSGAYSSYPNSANAKVYSDEYDADAAENRSLGYLCYLGILFLIPYAAKPDSQFLRYHCNQGLVLLLFSVLVSVCSYLPILGGIAGGVGSIFALYCLIKGLSNVAKGKRSPLPVIGDITIIK